MSPSSSWSSPIFSQLWKIKMPKNINYFVWQVLLDRLWIMFRDSRPSWSSRNVVSFARKQVKIWIIFFGFISSLDRHEVGCLGSLLVWHSLRCRDLLELCMSHSPLQYMGSNLWCACFCAIFGCFGTIEFLEQLKLFAGGWGSLINFIILFGSPFAKAFVIFL